MSAFKNSFLFKSLDVEFGDESVINTDDGLRIIRPEPNTNVRFAFLTCVKPKACECHYLQRQKVTIRCLGGQGEVTDGICCHRSGDPTFRMVALAIGYLNADELGKLPKGLEPVIEIGYVRLSRPNYRDVSRLAPEGTTIYDIDIVMSKRLGGDGYEFKAICTPPRYKTMGMEAEVEALATPFVDGKKLTSKLPTKMTELETKALLDGESCSPSLADAGEE
jgi:hypothetical protein